MARPKRSETDNPMVAAGAVKRREPFNAEGSLKEGIDGSTIKEVARERKFEEIDNKFETISTLRKLLRSGLSVNNYPIQEFKALSPEPVDWYVSFYFPVAEDKDGKRVPTYVDQPKNKRQIDMCAKKAVVMKKLGLRYFVFTEDTRYPAGRMDNEDSINSDSMIKEGHVVTL